MALAVGERNALLEQVWHVHGGRQYVRVAELLRDLPTEELVREPELGVTLCFAWYQLGELNRSVSLIRRLTEPCERRGNTPLCRRRINNEALIRIARGEPAAAESLLSRLSTLAEDARDVQMTAWLHNNLATLYCMRGMLDFALSHSRRSIAAGQRLGDLRHLSLCYLNMGVIYFRQDQVRKASACWITAADISRDAGSVSELAQIELNQGFLHEAEGDVQLALASCSSAGERFRSVNNRKGEGGIHHLKGRIALRDKRVDEARPFLEAALSIYESTSYREGEAQVLEDLAEVRYLEGDTRACAGLLRRSISTYVGTGNLFEARRIRSRLAGLAAGPS